MAKHDQSRLAGKGSTPDSHRGGHEASMRWTFVVLAVFVSMLCTWGYWIVGKANADSGVTFSTEITGSSKDGFDLYAANPDEKAYKCKATVTVTMDDGQKHSFDYPRSGTTTVRGKTDKMWFGGEAGLKPAPIADVKVTAASCLPAPDDD